MPWTEGTLLTLTHRPLPPAKVDEIVAITSDGTIWLWVGHAVDSSRRDLVGAFSTDATPDQLEQAHQVVAAIASRGAQPPGGPGGPGRAGGLEVSTETASRVVGNGTGGPEAAQILALTEDLTSAALASPLAAARIAARVRPGEQTQVSVVIRGEGTQDVGLLVDVNKLVVHWLDDAGSTVHWEPLPKPPMGLVDANAKLLDGVRGTARIPPGTSGAISVPMSPPAGATALSLQVTGRLDMIGLWESTGQPMDLFEARSDVVPLAPAS